MNIQTMLQKISEAGLSDYDIAQQISTANDVVTQPTVNRWRNGVTKEPNYARYIRVKDLYERTVKAA